MINYAVSAFMREMKATLTIEPHANGQSWQAILRWNPARPGAEKMKYKVFCKSISAVADYPGEALDMLSQIVTEAGW